MFFQWTNKEWAVNHGQLTTRDRKGCIHMACTVSVSNGALPQQEINAYIDRAREKFGEEPKALHITVDGEEVELRYDYQRPFQRIRRITGYLVGTMDRFNNAKRVEEQERLRHECTPYRAEC